MRLLVIKKIIELLSNDPELDCLIGPVGNLNSLSNKQLLDLLIEIYEVDLYYD